MKAPLEQLKARLRRNQRLVAGMRWGRWLISLCRRPRLLLFTVYYMLRLKRCGELVSFSSTMIIRNPSNISIGSRCSFSNFVILDGHDRIEIGDDCMFANGVCIATATHDYDVDPMNSTQITAPTIIRDNVWIGIGATILHGVTIGEGSVVGAMSLVTRDVTPRTIVAGVPAGVIRQRKFTESSPVPKHRSEACQ
jgi:acetyltransferase-like isoleucine patch superfamily enzyme